jgi:WD40 repeat protein
MNVENGTVSQMIKEFSGGGTITDVCFDNSGDLLFISDSVGVIRTYQFNSARGIYNRVQFCKVNAESKPVTSIEYKGWYIKKVFIAELLVSCLDNQLYLYGVHSDGSLTLKRTLSYQNSKNNVNAHFCPLIPTDKDGACIVSGGEDMTIYIYDVTKHNKPVINKLMGHSSPVVDVSWNYDESILASCDTSGTVIFWKRDTLTK